MYSAITPHYLPASVLQAHIAMHRQIHCKIFKMDLNSGDLTSPGCFVPPHSLHKHMAIVNICLKLVKL